MFSLALVMSEIRKHSPPPHAMTRWVHVYIAPSGGGARALRGSMTGSALGGDPPDTAVEATAVRPSTQDTIRRA